MLEGLLRRLIWVWAGVIRKISLHRVKCEMDLGGWVALQSTEYSRGNFRPKPVCRPNHASRSTGIFYSVVWFQSQERSNFLSVFSDTKASYNSPLLMSHRLLLGNKENNDYLLSWKHIAGLWCSWHLRPAPLFSGTSSLLLPGLLENFDFCCSKTIARRDVWLSDVFDQNQKIVQDLLNKNYWKWVRCSHERRSTEKPWCWWIGISLRAE